MQIKKLFNYKKHIFPLFCPLIDFKISHFNGNNNECVDLIISLTSYEKRLKSLKYTLYSLFSQNLKPKKIILWLAEGTIIPKEISFFEEYGLEIEYCKDIGPYTKLIYALKKYPNNIIVTADDDIYYPKNWLEKLYKSYQKYPQDIHCHRAHKITFNDESIAPYENWNKQTLKEEASFFNFLTGVGGVLYPAKPFTEDVFNQELFTRIAPFADDVWFWAMSILNNRKIRVVDKHIKNLIVVDIFLQLSENNLYSKNKKGGNDTQLSAVLKEFPQILNLIKNSRKKRVVYDASSLYVYKTTSGKRAGIYNVALNLLDKFTNDSSFDITLYSDYKYYYFLKQFSKDKGYYLINTRTLLQKLLGYIFWLIKGFPNKITYSYLYLLRIFDSITPKNNKLSKILTEYDIYFSPFEGIIPEAFTTNLSKYQFIHDVIPLKNNKKLPCYHWAHSVFKNINNEISYFVNSEYTKKDFLSKFPHIVADNVTVTYLGYSPKNLSNNDIYKKYSIPKEKKYILSLCTIGERKNLNFVIRNFSQFIKTHQIDDLVLVIAGSIWDSYKNKIKISNKDAIIFTGYIDDEDIPNIFSKALIFVYPSLYEGFGLPVIEAMSYKTPVITSNTTSLPEVGGDASILIDPTSDDEILNAFQKLYYNDSLRQDLILKGELQSAKFSWDNCYNKIKRVIL